MKARLPRRRNSRRMPTLVEAGLLCGVAAVLVAAAVAARHPLEEPAHMPLSAAVHTPWSAAPGPEAISSEERAVLLALAPLIAQVRAACADPELARWCAETAASHAWLTRGEAAVRPAATLSTQAMRRVLARACADCPPAADLIVCLIDSIGQARTIRDFALERYLRADQAARAAAFAPPIAA